MGKKVEKGNFEMFETLAGRQDNLVVQMTSLIVDHLSSLLSEIKRYFPDATEEFIDMVNDSSAHDNYKRERVIGQFLV